MASESSSMSLAGLSYTNVGDYYPRKFGPKPDVVPSGVTERKNIPLDKPDMVALDVINIKEPGSVPLFHQQHTSVDGYHEPHVQPSKSSSRQNIPRCRNSITSTTEEQPHIGNYRLLKTIGKGNFAKVKLARHILTGREVAVKIIDKTQLNPTSLQKVKLEEVLCNCTIKTAGCTYGGAGLFDF
ncbi:UNVERIFIED_CONTAM: hypothetical protein FKN15_001252 [Acipenser sinensis]